MFTSKAMSGHLLTFVAAGALAMGASACGDSDDDSSASNSPEQTSSVAAGDDRGQAADEGGSKPKPSSKPKSGSGSSDPGKGSTADTPSSGYTGAVQRPAQVGSREERLATEAVADMYAALATNDAEGVCAVVSKEARDQIAEGVAVGEGGADVTCEESFSRFLAAARQNGALGSDFKAKVVKADIDGDTAQVTVSIGGRSGKLDLVKENGKWRVGTAGAALGK